MHQQVVAERKCGVYLLRCRSRLLRWSDSRDALERLPHNRAVRQCWLASLPEPPSAISLRISLGHFAPSGYTARIEEGCRMDANATPRVVLVHDWLTGMR